MSPLAAPKSLSRILFEAGAIVPLGPDPFPDAREAARAIVANRWTEIGAVAAALLERRRLSGDEVRAIVADH